MYTWVKKKPPRFTFNMCALCAQPKSKNKREPTSHVPGALRRIRGGCLEEGPFELGLEQGKNREQGGVGRFPAEGTLAAIAGGRQVGTGKWLFLRPFQVAASSPPSNRVSSEAHRLLWSA